MGLGLGMNSVSGAVRACREKQSFGYADVAAPAEPAPIVAADADYPCEFEIVSSREAFDALADDWNELFARAGRGEQVFQAFDWNRHWCNHYLRPRERQRRRLAILTGRRQGRLVMVWPLVTARVAGLLQLSWMGDPVSQYGDILAEESPDALALQRAAWAHLLAAIKPDLVWLARVREDATIAPLIAELDALVTQRRAARYARREDAENTAPSRNRRRNAAKLGDVRFVEETGNAAASTTGAMAIGWKRGQLLERGILAPAVADPRFAAFFADVLADPKMASACRTVAFECNGTPAAASILVTYKDYIAGHVAAFDPAFEKASVGMLMLEGVRARAFAEGFAVFDLLAPADPYKARLARNEIGVIDWAVPVTGAGGIYARLYLARLRGALKTVFAALPAPVGRFIAARYESAARLS
jgi:CelD/BcsL family acetyltransferase involved in cellulose biosynthesis